MCADHLPFDLIPRTGAGPNQINLETAAVVTTFILAGRPFEARAKRRVGAALKALVELGTIKQNLVWAFGHNVAALPLSCGWTAQPGRSPAQ